MKTGVQAQVKAPSQPAFTPVQVGLLQRKCACGGSAGLGGQCDECRDKKLLGLQTKLAVSEPGDIYEREADRIADAVMRMSAPRGTIDAEMAPHDHHAPQRVSRATIFPPAAPTHSPVHNVPPIIHEILRSPGQPLDPATRAFMEPRFGHDFSKVRVHPDTKAAEAARVVDAKAFTVGQDVVFSEGYYTPYSRQGSKLLAHELAHVIQQGRRNASPPPLRSGLLEQTDDAAVSASAVDSGPIHVGGASAPGLARQPLSGSLGPNNPRSLTRSLLKDEENLDDVALMVEIQAIRNWLNARPSGPDSDYLRLELKLLKDQELERMEKRVGRALLPWFMAHTYERDMDLGGVGLFHAEYAPSQGTLTISVPIQFNFKDSYSEKTHYEGDPMGNKPVTLVTEKEYKVWNSTEIENWQKKFIKVVQDTWSSEHTQHIIYCHRPGWETLKAKVIVKVDEIGETTPGTHYFEARVYRGDSPEGSCGSGSAECVGKGYATLRYSDVERASNVAAHEFGHMLGLGDEYKDASNPQATEASHSGLVYGEFGYGVPRLDETRTDRFRESILSGGGNVLPEHGVVFLEAMRRITGIEEWHLRPK